MKKYKVEIKEILIAYVEVEANNPTDALYQAEQKYLTEEVVLNENNLVDTKYTILNEKEEMDTEEANWIKKRDAIYDDLINELKADDELVMDSDTVFSYFKTRCEEAGIPKEYYN